MSLRQVGTIVAVAGEKSAPFQAINITTGTANQNTASRNTTVKYILSLGVLDFQNQPMMLCCL